MIPVFLEAAVRSLLVGLAVALGLRIFRVRNVLAQKAAWGLVLISALAMPLLSPMVTQWPVLPTGINISLPAHPMTLLEELQAHILSKGGSSQKPAPPPALNPEGNASGIRQSGMPQAADAPQTTERPSANGQRAGTTEQNAFLNPGHGQKTQASWSGSGVSISPGNVLLFFYCGITALFFMRIALGVVATIRLWRTAAPIPSWQLPYDAACLQVRASSKIASPLTVGSAILLPADYASWDTEKLRIVLAHERSHIRQGDFYLQLLASLYAAIVWFSPLGWWIKHQLAELAEAISDRAGMEEAASCTSYAQILLEFAAAPRRVRIGVAMARPGSLSRRIERLLNDNSFRQCFAGGRRALVGVALVPVAILSCAMLVHVQAATTSQSSPLILTGARNVAASPDSTTSSHSEAVEVSSRIETEQASSQLDAVSSDSETHMVAVSPTAPAIRADGGDGTKAGGMQEGGSLSFDRTLTAGGAAQLSVSTGSGSIRITRSSGNEIRVHGQIHVSEEGSEEEARQIAANPPIEQNGDSIRVGQHQEHWHGISIDYRIEAPAGTQLSANSGSGEVIDEGVGKDAKLQTGSGDIRATGLEGAFTVKTGSGNIVAEQTGQGDVVAETGSGDIELKDIHGGFHGETGSGDIKANGTPSSSWTLQTGSGSIELWTGNAGVTLDASTGSGSVNSEHEMVVQGSFDHHHIHGTLNGGGPTIRVQTGSGDIRLH